MSLTKRIFIDKDPAYEDVRLRAADERRDFTAEFPFRIAINRKNATGGRRHWDPFWPIALSTAANDLKIEYVNVNSGMFFRTDAGRAAVLGLAETNWRDRIERYAAHLSER